MGSLVFRVADKEMQRLSFSDHFFNGNISTVLWSECVHDKLCINVASFTEMKRNSEDCDALAAHHRESVGIFEKSQRGHC